MGANRFCNTSRHPDPLHALIPFARRKRTGLSDSKYRESLSVARDRMRQRQLEETSKRLSSALDQVMEAIAILDVRDGAILYANTLFSKVFGGPHPSVLKQPFVERFDCPLLTSALEQARSGQAWTGRSSLKTCAGRNITFEGTVSPVRNAEGAVESLVVRLRDISLEVEKDRHLRQAQKMDALGALAGGMAHDFNNLIGAILNAADLIEMQIEPNDPVHGKLEIIHQVGNRARELSAQILNFSRRTEDEWTTFDLTDLATEVTNLLRAMLPRNVEVRPDLAEGIRMLGDPSQLHQVIMNLGINGSQAMQPLGGILSIRLQRVEADQATADLPIPAPSVLLTIEDTGCGMDPQILERIFEPFFTTKEAGRGTGLGLSVVYSIVQGHGGCVHVSSEPGKGSSFTIHLPIQREVTRGLDRKLTDSLLDGLY
jgi:PAS domain S-box-containing protein